MHGQLYHASPPPVRGLDPVCLDPQALARANINPRTRLATDYLNHFNELVMMLELLSGEGEFVVDILAWQPVSYPDYFKASHFKDRELAFLAYQEADPQARQDLETLTDAMNVALLSTIESLRRAPSADAAAELGAEAVASLKPLLARAGAVINGQYAVPVEVADGAEVQAMVDAVFEIEHFAS